MKTFNNRAAQGDVEFCRINELPSGLIPIDKENGAFIVAHSETGHNHVIERPDARVNYYQDPNDQYCAYLEVIADDVAIEHKRSYDTHETILFPVGFFRVRRQVEYTPEGMRAAAD